MFIGTAHAAPAAAAASGPDFLSFLPMVVIFVLFYFMLVRPQQKKAKELQNMIAALQKGDEVVTTGGAVGKVVKLAEQYVTLELSANTQVTFQRTAIQAVLPKGTLKDL